MNKQKSIFDPIGEVTYSEQALEKTIYLEFLALDEQIFLLEKKGIELFIEQHQLRINLHIAILDGINVPKLYDQLQHVVKEKLETSTSLKLTEFNINVANVLTLEEFKKRYLEVATQLAEKMEAGPDGVEKVMDNFSNKMKASLNSVGNVTKSAFDTASDQTKKAFTTAGESAKQAFDSASGSAKEAFDSASQNAKDTIDSAEEKMKEATDKVIQTTKDAADTAGKLTKDTLDKTNDEIDKAAKATKDKIDEVKTALSSEELTTPPDAEIIEIEMVETNDEPQIAPVNENPKKKKKTKKKTS